MKKLDLDEESIYTIGKQVAKEVSEKLTEILLLELKKLNARSIDKKGVLQSYICSLIASFMLAHSIKIFSESNLSSFIESLCQECIDRAFEMSKIASFKSIKEEVH